MSSPSMKEFRAAVQQLCPTPEKEEVTAPDLARFFGLSGESQMNVIRGRLRDMAKRGELTKTGTGRWCRSAGEPIRRGEGYARMWRAIRSSQATFTAQEIYQLSQMDESSVSKYLKFLDAEGFISKCGKKGTVTLWGLTLKGHDQRETPFPPKDITIPYLAERTAVGKLNLIMHREDMRQPGVRKKIAELLAVLNRSFNQFEKKEKSQ